MPVVPSTLDTLRQYAQEVLVVAEDSLVGTLGGVPDRVFRSPARPPYDCPQLTVHVSRLGEASMQPQGNGDAEALRANVGSVIHATYVITLLRCAPAMGSQGQAPAPAAIQAIADIIEQDGWALWNGIRHAYQNDLIFEHCAGVHFDDGVPVEEQGSYTGWIFTIRAMVPGIPNPGVTT